MYDSLKTVLSIAGSDPCGCAGIHADIRVGIETGVHVMSAITAVTVQNSRGVRHVNVINKDILYSQLNSIIEETIPDAVKIGMTGSTDNIDVISEFIKQLPEETPIVVDPILKASSGGHLSKGTQEDIITHYQTKLFPYADVVTPNIEEADNFLASAGLNESLLNSEKAIKLLRLCNTNAVILKGGHANDEYLSDFLADNFDGNFVLSEVRHKKIECNNLHGTGCTYSTLLASYMALGFSLHDAFVKTSEKIYDIIKRSTGYRLGESTYGPLNINSYRI